MALSRRQILRGAAAAAVAAYARGSQTALATASQPSTPVNFAVPPNACDCHTHVFGDPRRFPFAATRAYTPETASIEELRSLHRTLHTTRVVIVQPSVYGTDNRCTLNAVSTLGSTARAVVVIDQATTNAQLDDLHAAGVRGIRINLATAGQNDPMAARGAFLTAVDRVGPRGWHIQMYTQPSVIDAIADAVSNASLPVVFDHFGGAQAGIDVRQPGFDTLVGLVRSGRAYVKISAPYRNSDLAPAYRDMAPLAAALISANNERILWGSDWPHPNPPRAVVSADGTTPFYRIDDGLVFNQLAVWEPDAARRRTILVDNPARLYAF